MQRFLTKLVHARDSVPLAFKKYATLVGGFLMLLSLHSFYTFGNMMPYIVSYLRAEDASSLRYSDGIWFEVVYSTMQVSLATASKNPVPVSLSF
jgi:hypothetical protein